MTEYNTAHNKRITTLPVDEPTVKMLKRKRKSISFHEEEIIINPEDVDPTVGRFRHMVSVQVIPNKVILNIVYVVSIALILINIYYFSEITKRPFWSDLEQF